MKRMPSKFIGLTVIVAAFGLTQAVSASDRAAVVNERTARAGPPQVSITDLGTLPGGSSSGAAAINDLGQVVGSSRTASGDRHAVLWQRDGTIIDLGTLPGDDTSTATGINARGQVVGYSWLSPIEDVAAHAFLWQDGVMTDLGTLPGDDTYYASGINARGQISGWSRNSGHAVLWEHGTVTDLGTLPGGTYSNAFAINNRGQVVGNSEINGAESDSEGRAFLWQQGTMTDLGVLEPGFVGDVSRANAIDDRGQVVGESLTISGPHAVLWQDGTITDLGTIGGCRDSIESSAKGINARGQVVGDNNNRGYCGGVTPGAFLWQDGVMTDLGTLPGGNGPGACGYINCSSASGINNHGQISGTSNTASGVRHAVRWQIQNTSTAVTSATTKAAKVAEVGEAEEPRVSDQE